jgi:hypothetical protein
VVVERAPDGVPSLPEAIRTRPWADREEADHECNHHRRLSWRRLPFSSGRSAGSRLQVNRAGASAARLSGMSGGTEPPRTMAAPWAAKAGTDSIPEPPWPAKK